MCRRRGEALSFCILYISRLLSYSNVGYLSSCRNLFTLLPIFSVLDTTHGFKLFGFKAEIDVYKWLESQMEAEHSFILFYPA